MRIALDRRTLRAWRGRIALAAVALAVVAALVWAWMPRAELVEVARVTEGDVVVDVVEDGRTRLRERYVVAAPVAGTLRRIAFEPGDRVVVGQTVAVITPTPAPLLDPRARAETEARLDAARQAQQEAAARAEAARVALETASRDAARLPALVTIGAVSRQELEQAEADAAIRAEELAAALRAVERATHEARALRATLAPPAATGVSVEVPAPVSGDVLEVLQESETAVTAGMELVVVGDPDALEVVVDVLSTDAVRIERGAPARIERWGGDPLPAAVSLVEPVAFTEISALGVEEQRVNVILDIEAPAAEYAALGADYRVEARVVIDRADDVPTVPEAAVFRHDDGFAVFRVDGRRARLAPVRLGLRNGVVAEVVDGLALGDTVIVHPSEAIEDGVRVKVPGPRRGGAP